MKPDDHVCLCFHVTKRKLQNFIRIEKPRRVGQLSECFGAGTGCGWCRPFLKVLFDQANGEIDSDQGALDDLGDLDSMTAEQYAEFRAKYVKAGKGTPPSGSSP